jgi:hypothetical protein
VGIVVDLQKSYATLSARLQVRSIRGKTGCSRALHSKQETVLKYQKGNIMAFGALVLAILAVMAIAGYVLNIVAIVTDWVWPLTGLLIVRLVGIILPIVGAIVGWF